MCKLPHTGWRAWALRADHDGPVLASPFVFTFTATGPVVHARCPACPSPPGPECECGIYAMTDPGNLPLWCYPADVVTPLRLHGPVLPGVGDPFRGSFAGEVRAKAVTLQGPCMITPALAHHATALQARYGVEFMPDPALAVSGTAAIEAQARGLLAQPRVPTRPTAPPIVSGVGVPGHE